MDNVVSLKRPYQDSPELCLICQETNSDVLETKTPQGITSLKQCAESRKKCRDYTHYEAISRIENIDVGVKIVCHRKCYSNFVHKRNIQILQSKLKINTDGESRQTIDKAASSSKTLTRRSAKSINWDLCMFCQGKKYKKQLFNVTTFKVSNSILNDAKLDNTMRLRLSDVNDLIAAEGKYHNTCLHLFRYGVHKTKSDDTNTEIAMVFLIQELEYAATKSQIMRLSDIWDRYCILSEDTLSTIPQSFHSRRSYFKKALQSKLKNLFQFISPLEKFTDERDTLLVPNECAVAMLTEAHYATNDNCDEQLTIPSYNSSDDFLSLVHVALKLRADLFSLGGHTGLNVSENDAINCVPESLYLFLNLLYGGQELLEKEFDPQDPESDKKTKILSVAQDIVYGVSDGKKWTPKHIGLASTLHQMTRSKHLVNLFHSAGHTLSYRDVLKVDTALAEKTLESMDPRTGHVIPLNLAENVFTHFTADNIDISDSTLDGKNTFHATQVAAWQRGDDTNLHLAQISISGREKLQVPEQMDAILPANITEGKTTPEFANKVELKTFSSKECEVESAKRAKAIDMAFHLYRNKSNSPPTWSAFNQSISIVDPHITKVGYMPIIQAPAHEIDTLNTVVQKCMHISEKIGQSHTVITVDQALYFKLMDLKWAVPAYRDKLIPRMGGLHISMNYLKIIGDHMKGSGLHDIWVESNLLGPIAADQVLAGKHYNRGMRAHKITSQAIWGLFLPQLLSYIEQKDMSLHRTLMESKDSKNIEKLVDEFENDNFKDHFDNFVKNDQNPNYQFWWTYLEMVSVLLLFTRAIRDGLWDLYLYAFRCMLPLFYRYDHTNYARWGTVYLADVHQLPPEVLKEFKNGNFVVKRSSSKFNQVDPDQSQEWLNSTGKKGGGIIGITRTPTALSRWSLSYNFRSHISHLTKSMYKIKDEDIIEHKETSKSRQSIDQGAEESITNMLERYNVADPQLQGDHLLNVATKDIATDSIETSLLSALQLGQDQVEKFVKARLQLSDDEHAPKVLLRDSIKRNNPYTFASLYVTDKASKSVVERGKILKADRNTLHRLVTAYKAGRDVNMAEILKHELLPVPISISETNGSLKTGNKSILLDELVTGIETSDQITIQGQSALIVDGQALVQSLKIQGEITFGHYADLYVNTVLNKGQPYQRIDVVFDRYRPHSIKSNTRKQRTKTYQPVRRVIESRNVPLPKNWSNFLALPANKSDLARFLSEELIMQAPTEKTLVVGGGFQQEETVESNSSELNMDELKANHEEADTRIILHAVHCSKRSNCTTVVVSARDTDVFLLLLRHIHEISTTVWMMAGTAKKRKYIPVNAVLGKPLMSDELHRNLLGFHALTGSDTTSYFCGISKKSAFKIFTANANLIEGLGYGQMSDKLLKTCEQFICKMYGQNVTSADTARNAMFGRCTGPEHMPPTSDACSFHIKRAHYQSLVWNQATVPIPDLPAPTDMGWRMTGDTLQPVLMTRDPIPQACLEFIACKCTSGCRTLRCKCKRTGLLCTDICKCDQNITNCMNSRQ